MGYVDDNNLEGKIATVAKDAQIIIDSYSTTGLVLNASKYEIICSNGDLVDQYPIFKDFIRVFKEDLNILGAPVFEGKVVASALIAKLTDLERSVERLSLLQAHDGLCLLRSALAIPKLQYILRTSPCAGNPLLSTFDKVLRCGLSTIHNVNLNDTRRTQATLPVYMGGLGVRSAVCWHLHPSWPQLQPRSHSRKQICRIRYAVLTTRQYPCHCLYGRP